MRSEAEVADTETGAVTSRDLLTVWEVISYRRTNYDTMMWQTPALGMTAQAFLLTLSLASATSSLGRIVAAALSAAISLMIIQLMMKHRRHEMLDTRMLEDLEVEMGLPTRSGLHPHAKDRYPQDQQDAVDGELGRLWIRGRWVLDLSSFSVWCYGQFAFFVVGMAIIALEILGRGDLLK